MANLTSGKMELDGLGHDVGGGMSDGLAAEGEGVLLCGALTGL